MPCRPSAQEWGLTTTQKGLLGTAIFLGMLAGALVWGRLSDLFGRKVGFISTVAIDSVFGLLSAFAPSFRLAGDLARADRFWGGRHAAGGLQHLCRIPAQEKRGRYLVLLESFWALGVIAAAGLAWLIVPRLGWRWLLAVSALPGMIIFFIRRHVPESPRYLLVNGQPEQARQVLEQVAQRERHAPARPAAPPVERTPAQPQSRPMETRACAAPPCCCG